LSNKEKVINELKGIADSEIAEHSARFFKSGPGEYGEGDQFLGIRVPNQRAIAKSYSHISLNDVHDLLKSPYHEIRLTALLILVYKYQKAKKYEQRENIYQFYIDHLDKVNNWDLVDSTAKYIVGQFLHEYNQDRSVLYTLSDSKNLWERRIAIIATFHFINKGDFETTLELSEKYLTDHEDLIHKATGWMLREIGKQNESVLINFLDMHYQKMPRTMLRYSIEKLDEPVRQRYLKGEI
jgi:3-methyladenine DNA glycosylase AlkD